MVERFVDVEEVTGSNPVPPTNSDLTGRFGAGIIFRGEATPSATGREGEVMFSLKRKQPKSAAVSVPETAVIIPFPSAKVPERSVTVKGQQTYEQIAKKIGFTPEELVRNQVLSFLSENAIKVYDYAEVDAYMVQERKKAGKKFWMWRPLRDKDIIEDFCWGCDEYNTAAYDGYYEAGDDACRPYERLVPHYALEKVLRLESKFKNKVAFFVSDYADPKPDPFIGVRSRRCADVEDPSDDMIIFDVWKEPGFGIKR